MKFKIVTLLTSIAILTATLPNSAVASDMNNDFTNNEKNILAEDNKYKIAKDNKDIRIVTYSENNINFGK